MERKVRKMSVLTSYPFFPLLLKLCDSLHLELLHLLAIFHIGVILELASEHVPQGDALGALSKEKGKGEVKAEGGEGW